MTEKIEFRNNGLNLFRLLAALQVLQGHAVAHLSLQRVPVLSDFIAFFSGVPIFFTLSGFLIWKSIGLRIHLAITPKNVFGGFFLNYGWQ